MPIYFAEPMQDVTILRITGTDKVKKHLAEIGFVPGESIMVVNKINENVIVKIKGVSVAVSHELAKRIFV